MVLLCAMSNAGLSVPTAGVLSLVRKTTVHISGLVAARDKSIAALCLEGLTTSLKPHILLWKVSLTPGVGFLAHFVSYLAYGRSA